MENVNQQLEQLISTTFRGPTSSATGEYLYQQPKQHKSTTSARANIALAKRIM